MISDPIMFLPDLDAYKCLYFNNFLYVYFSCENSYFLKYASLYTIVLQVPALLTLNSQTSGSVC